MLSLPHNEIQGKRGCCLLAFCIHRSISNFCSTSQAPYAKVPRNNGVVGVRHKTAAPTAMSPCLTAARGESKARTHLEFLGWRQCLRLSRFTAKRCSGILVPMLGVRDLATLGWEVAPNSANRKAITCTRYEKDPLAGAPLVPMQVSNMCRPMACLPHR